MSVGTHTRTTSSAALGTERFECGSTGRPILWRRRESGRETDDGGTGGGHLLRWRETKEDDVRGSEVASPQKGRGLLEQEDDELRRTGRDLIILKFNAGNQDYNYSMVVKCSVGGHYSPTMSSAD